MEPAVLLSPSDVSVIRRYVQTKYAPLPKARQAEIVAEAVRGTIERRLPELDSLLKQRITRELIRRCLIGESREVVPEDVLDVCADLAPGEAERLLDLDRLHTWLEERERGRWSREQLASRLAGSRPGPRMGLGMGSGTNIADFPGESPAMASSDDAAASARLRGSRGRRVIWGLLSALLAAGMALWALPETERTNADLPDELNAGIVRENAASEADAGGMPALLRFREFEEEPVLGYLHSRDSLLAEEPYFSAIVASAEEYDVNPLLLLAITGQEQGFVPKSGLHAERIANNPFNVFHSWEEYNTDIRDSSRIAAKLIAKLAGSVPEGEEPIAWMNLTYAEDPAWSTGVRLLFEKLTELSELSELSEPSSSLSLSLSSEEAELP